MFISPRRAEKTERDLHYTNITQTVRRQRSFSAQTLKLYLYQQTIDQTTSMIKCPFKGYIGSCRGSLNERSARSTGYTGNFHVNTGTNTDFSASRPVLRWNNLTDFKYSEQSLVRFCSSGPHAGRRTLKTKSRIVLLSFKRSEAEVIRTIKGTRHNTKQNEAVNK